MTFITKFLVGSCLHSQQCSPPIEAHTLTKGTDLLLLRSRWPSMAVLHAVFPMYNVVCFPSLSKELIRNPEEEFEKGLQMPKSTHGQVPYLSKLVSEAQPHHTNPPIQMNCL